jgi:hypothetical protein
MLGEPWTRPLLISPTIPGEEVARRALAGLPIVETTLAGVYRARAVATAAEGRKELSRYYRRRAEAVERGPPPSPQTRQERRAARKARRAARKAAAL